MKEIVCVQLEQPIDLGIKPDKLSSQTTHPLSGDSVDLSVIAQEVSSQDIKPTVRPERRRLQRNHTISPEEANEVLRSIALGKIGETVTEDTVSNTKVDRKPNGYWRDLDNILARAKQLADRNIRFTQKSLVEAGESSFSSAVAKYFPGSLPALRIAIGIEEKVPNYPEGWMTIFELSKVLERSRDYVGKRAIKLELEYPELTGTKYLDKSGKPAVHYSPEFKQKIEEVLPQNVPEGWMSVHAIAKNVKRTGTNIRRIAAEFIERFPDLAPKKYLDREGRIFYYYPPELTSLIKQKIEANPIIKDEKLTKLSDFIIGTKAEFSDLEPFIVDISSKPSKKGNIASYYSIYIGKTEKNKSCYLNIPIPDSLDKQEGKIISVQPQTLAVGDKPYYWMDFYNSESLDNNMKRELIASCRLKPEEPINKIDFQKWHGIGEQLLVDYLTGENGIVFDNLRPFEIDAQTKTGLSLYRFGSKKELGLHLGENPNIQKGDRLKFTSKQDEQHLYEWIDISKSAEDGSEDIVASYRLFPEQCKISRYWPGVERQLIFDYLSGDKRITFDNLRPINVFKNKNDEINLVTIEGKQIVFYLPKGIQEQEELVLVPRVDEERRYQWLEAYRSDSITNLPTGDVIASGRIINGKIDHANWLGLERQILRDFIRGEVGFDSLKPLRFSIGKGGDYINLWKENGKKVYLVLSKYFNLNQGDNVCVVPENETREMVSFLLVKEDKLLARYVFSKENNQFTLRDNFVVENIQAISPQEANEYFKNLIAENTSKL